MFQLEVLFKGDESVKHRRVKAYFDTLQGARRALDFHFAAGGRRYYSHRIVDVGEVTTVSETSIGFMWPGGFTDGDGVIESYSHTSEDNVD